MIGNPGRYLIPEAWFSSSLTVEFDPFQIVEQCRALNRLHGWALLGVHVSYREGERHDRIGNELELVFQFEGCIVLFSILLMSRALLFMDLVPRSFRSVWPFTSGTFENEFPAQCRRITRIIIHWLSMLRRLNGGKPSEFEVMLPSLGIRAGARKVRKSYGRSGALQTCIDGERFGDTIGKLTQMYVPSTL